ncbi:hypothetical protein FHX42_004252 [Saccharopolyspora lacisalsi]|uniref:Uncharacterized protein n=1 Tax=Halosaccharopolyspora lacisalsi TaxID=1000566 RepID=A0A839E0R0_9PSEU|nr:hypothetical protein [Halosaccharopolyspora lacisalsi]MBA8826873.1 hypothetical protein [Halosaccharopolyspora lacisalsi]
MSTAPAQPRADRSAPAGVADDLGFIARVLETPAVASAGDRCARLFTASRYRPEPGVR